MERDQVMGVVLSAKTPQKCAEAEQVLQAWMREHPRDFGMLDAGEQLAMIRLGTEDAAQEPILARTAA